MWGSASQPISCVAGLPQVASERMFQLTTNADCTRWYTQRCINIEQTFIIYTLVLYMMYHCRLIWLNVDYVLIMIPLKKKKKQLPHCWLIKKNSFFFNWGACETLITGSNLWHFLLDKWHFHWLRQKLKTTAAIHQLVISRTQSGPSITAIAGTNLSVCGQNQAASTQLCDSGASLRLKYSHFSDY